MISSSEFNKPNTSKIHKAPNTVAKSCNDPFTSPTRNDTKVSPDWIYAEILYNSGHHYALDMQLTQRPLVCLLYVVKGEGGRGGVPWVQIMENEFEYLADRGSHGSHLGEKFVKKYCS